MAGRTALIFHERYTGRGTSPVEQSWQRYQKAWELIEQLGLLQHGLLCDRPAPVADEDLLRVHPRAYLQHIREADRRGSGYVDYGDTPAYPGIEYRARVAVGGTLLAAKRILRGDYQHAFNPAGGLHHAQKDRAGGFCIFNDIVIAVRMLQATGLQRVAIVDIDGHHGDGTQALLYEEPILTISLHQYDGRFYPRTGALDEVGEGAGTGYNINIPLPRRTGEAVYLQAFHELVVPALRRYEPQFLIGVFGTDAHFQDPLVGLRLTTHAYHAIAETLHALAHALCAGRLLLLGSGGYNPDAVARCWAIMLGGISGAVSESHFPAYLALFDREEPAHDAKATAKAQQVIEELKGRLRQA